MRILTFAAASMLAAIPAFAHAQNEGTDAIPDAVDTPYPGGTITLDIDASDVARGIYRVTQTIPLAPGSNRLTLLLPKWLPGNHGPRGPIAELVDLRLTVDGRPVSWRRDPVDVHAFHVDLPAASRRLTARFLHTSPLRGSDGRVTMTPEMLNLQWEKMSLYPAGYFVRQIRVDPSVTLPSGWTAATALDGKVVRGDRLTWATTDYETLVDSPIFAGSYFRQWPLGRKVGLNVVADSPELLDLKPENQAELSALVDEAMATFGEPPFDRYEFLVALSKRLGDIGLEHLASSENLLEPKSFVTWHELDWDRNVLAHEFVHAWNGKYRRPEGLATPDYRTPMRDDLLWVYEGQTQFWGWVLAARSGVQDKDTVLGLMARTVANLANQPGRDWRSVADTTLDPVVAARKRKPYASLARGEDYYGEGALVWLEADQLIRRETGGRKSLDDFARMFFAHQRGGPRIAPFDFDDLVAALNRVHPHDWAAFLRKRIDEAGLPAPLAGIEEAGYRLVWKDKPNRYEDAWMKDAGLLDLSHSIGLTAETDGTVTGAIWDGPAFRARIVPGAKIVAVNGVAFTAEGLKQAIAQAAGTRKPLQLLVRREDRFETVDVPYYDGLRWAWLERTGSGGAGLDRLLAPRRKNSSQ
ncbi:MAG TPA: peptidase M61 [Novosphingobium sp.]|nr:peptidase M61 [Novosphingobium sp.]